MFDWFTEPIAVTVPRCLYWMGVISVTLHAVRGAFSIIGSVIGLATG